VAKPERRSRDYTPEEIAWLTDPGESVAAVMAPPPSESYGASTIKVPTWDPPSWVRGVLSEALIRQEGWGDVVGAPEQKARKLTVLARDELDDTLETKVFEFSPDHGGCIAAYGGGRGPDPLEPSVGCQGRFSPFGTLSMEIVGEGDERTLVVVEQLASEQVERRVPVDPLAPQTLLVEVIRPDVREPWTLRTDGWSCSLAKVQSLELGDVEES
jgi:hypothetical protein